MITITTTKAMRDNSCHHPCDDYSDIDSSHISEFVFSIWNQTYFLRVSSMKMKAETYTIGEGELSCCMFACCVATC
jgi:hypothetical protein